MPPHWFYYSQQQAADHLGVSLSAIGRWVRAERPPFGYGLGNEKTELKLGGS